jgi:hypothetical protein
MTKPWDTTFEHLLRKLAPQVLGTVARRFRDFSLAEDAVQEAMIAAFTQWPQEGVPDNPRGWLIQVACRRSTFPAPFVPFDEQAATRGPGEQSLTGRRHQ